MTAETETISFTAIKPAAYNPRVNLKPGDPEYEKLRRSIEEFGLVQSLVWNKQTGHLVGGHQRFKILKDRGDTEASVVVVDLPLDREKALNLSLNKVQGSWDEQLLASLLQDLSEIPDFDLELTGFETEEAEGLIAGLLGEGEQDEQFDVGAAMVSSGPTVTQPGDLILLGRDPSRQHRLLCADAMDAHQVRRLMGDERAILFATDPPYLQCFRGTNRPVSQKGGRPKAGKDWAGEDAFDWDDASANPDLYRNFTRVAVEEALQPNAAFYCWHASRGQHLVEEAWSEVDAFVHAVIIWKKNRAAMGRSWFLWQHEPCAMGWRKGHPPPRRDKTRLSTVWEIDTLPNTDERPDHPTPKPLDVFTHPMRQHTRAGEICYEPFAGSGTQFIAAERLRRRCFGLEISPKYVDLIVRRYIAYAGEQAVDPEVAERYRLDVDAQSKGVVS